MGCDFVLRERRNARADCQNYKRPPASGIFLPTRMAEGLREEIIAPTPVYSRGGAELERELIVLALQKNWFSMTKRVSSALFTMFSLRRMLAR